MAKNKKKAGTQQNHQADNKKIHEELMEKLKLDAEKEKKRIEKQAKQRAKVENLKKLNLEEQATFILPFKQKESTETFKNCEKNANLPSAKEEKVNCENSSEVLNDIDFDDDGIWDEEHGSSSSYQPAQDKKPAPVSTKQTSYEEQKKRHEENESGFHKGNTEDSQYGGKSCSSNKPLRFNKAQNFERNTNSSSSGKSPTDVYNTVDYDDGIWDDCDNSSSYQSTQKAAMNTESSTYQQRWQPQQPRNKYSQNQESSSVRRNAKYSQHGGKSYSNKQQYFNRNQNGKYRRDQPSNSEEAGPFSETTDWPTPNETAAVPVVNVWEERKAKQESILQMAPHNGYEEETMLQQALELSKRQTENDERKQREIAQEYEQQQKYLEQNPEYLSYLKQHSNIDDYEDCSEVKRRLSRNCSLPVTQFSSSMMNDQTISSYCNGARAKYKPVSSPENSYQGSVDCPEDVWTDNDDEHKLSVKKSTEVKMYDDDSPCEDGWEDCVEDISSYAEKPDVQKKAVRSSDDEQNQYVSTEFVNHLDDFKGVANKNEDGQSCNETSSKYEVQIPCQNLKDDTGSPNKDFSQKCDLQNAMTIKNKSTGMFQNVEFTINNGQHEFSKERSFPVLEGKIDQNRNSFQNTSNNEDALYEEQDNFSSSRSIASLKSSQKHCNEIPVLQRELEMKNAQVSECNAVSNQNERTNSSSTIEFNKKTNAIDHVRNEAYIGDVRVREIEDENLNVSLTAHSSIMTNVEKWVESTSIDAPRSKHDIMGNKAVPSNYLETKYWPDASLQFQSMEEFPVPSANFSDQLDATNSAPIKPPVQPPVNFADQPDATYSAPIKPPVQPNTNLPCALNQLDNNNSNIINSDNPNFMTIPNSNASFNPAFMVLNPAIAFNPAIASSNLPITNLSALSPFEWQQLYLTSSSFFTRQFMLSQNYALQMQQMAGLHSPFNAATTGLIPSNMFGPAYTPTNLPQFSASIGPFVSTASVDRFMSSEACTDPFASREINPFVSMTDQSLITNSSGQYSVPNNPSNIAPSSQYASNPMQRPSVSLPPGLDNNSQNFFNPEVPNHLMRSLMTNKELRGDGVGIPPPKPPQHLRQPRQNCSELSPLMHQANIRQTERFCALGRSPLNYQRAPFGNS